VAAPTVTFLSCSHLDQKFTGTTLGAKPDLGSLTVAGCDLVVEVVKAETVSCDPP
jgi:hypothetical protein